MMLQGARISSREGRREIDSRSKTLSAHIKDKGHIAQKRHTLCKRLLLSHWQRTTALTAHAPGKGIIRKLICAPKNCLPAHRDP
eukprot:1148161-Pelagomonas_calceolata.AAC.6